MVAAVLPEEEAEFQAKLPLVEEVAANHREVAPTDRSEERPLNHPQVELPQEAEEALVRKAVRLERPLKLESALLVRQRLLPNSEAEFLHPMRLWIPSPY